MTPLPLQEQLSLKQAAEVLNVSQLYLAKLLLLGEIPFFMANDIQFILLTDLLHFKEKFNRTCLRELEEQAKRASKFDVGY